MINKFIGGGQVFMHRIRMLLRVLGKTIHIALFVGVLTSLFFHGNHLKQIDWEAVFSYQKANFASYFDDAMNSARMSIGKEPFHQTLINAKTQQKTFVNIPPKLVLKNSGFVSANSAFLVLMQKIMLMSISFSGACFFLIFLFWTRFGKNLESEKIKDGSNDILKDFEVRSILKKSGKLSNFSIGKMSLVKNSETMHFLVSGATGSGKTNLIHNLLPQARIYDQAAVVVDQTGEMIAKYYDPSRGDIIFNPFDARSKAWDFWQDCHDELTLERFSKILFGFNRKKAGSHSDPLWEQSAEIVFNAAAEYQRGNLESIQALFNLVTTNTAFQLFEKLKNTAAASHLSGDNKNTAASILSVMATLAKPLGFLRDAEPENSFSLRKFFANLDKGSSAWLFLATKPSGRDLTLPLISCILELSFCALLDIGINEKRRLWFVVDELASLGRLPALSQIMAEGRKYGACVLAGLQSLNQLYSSYGAYEGSTIFGQFGTNFIFRNNEAAIAKMISSMCGQKTIYRQQKNTSFGAHEFRDGVSYTEQERQKNLVDYNDLAALEIGECFTLLPDPSVRLSRTKIPQANLVNRNSGFVERVVAKIPASELTTKGSVQTQLILESDLYAQRPNLVENLLENQTNPEESNEKMPLDPMFKI